MVATNSWRVRSAQLLNRNFGDYSISFTDRNLTSRRLLYDRLSLSFHFLPTLHYFWFLVSAVLLRRRLMPLPTQLLGRTSLAVAHRS